jgi:positive regulator of sigma E activity
MQARVVKKTGNELQLELLREPDGCSRCGICFMGRRKKTCMVTVTSSADVAPGDMVSLEYSEGRGVLMALQVFFFPVVIIIGFTGMSLYAGYSEFGSCCLALAGLVLYYFLLKKKKLSGIQITKIQNVK